MTLEEAIEKANKGDAEYMILVGDFFYKNESMDMAERLEQALPWYEKAAEAGNTNGAYRSMIFHEIYGLTNKQIGAWSEAADEYLKAFGYATKVLNSPELTEQTKPSVEQKQQEDCYQLAYCHYRMGNKKLAYSLSTASPEVANHVKAKMLGAICAFDIAETEVDFSIAESLLSIFDTYNLEPIFSTIKDEAEEVSLATGYVYLSILFNKFKNDTTKAFNVLTSGKKAIHTNGSRQLLEGELIHYKLKLFGGYQYVE